MQRKGLHVRFFFWTFLSFLFSTPSTMKLTKYLGTYLNSKSNQKLYLKCRFSKYSVVVYVKSTEWTEGSRQTSFYTEINNTLLFKTLYYAIWMIIPTLISVNDNRDGKGTSCLRNNQAFIPLLDSQLLVMWFPIIVLWWCCHNNMDWYHYY